MGTEAFLINGSLFHRFAQKNRAAGGFNFYSSFKIHNCLKTTEIDNCIDFYM